jgi:ATP-dependent Clp protease, protease subunit
MSYRPAGPVNADVPFRPRRPGYPGEPELPSPPIPGRPSWLPSPGPQPVPPQPSPRPGQVWLNPEPRGGVYDRLFARRIVMAHGHLGDELATSLCAQLLTLDAEGDDPIRFELQNLSADLPAALTVMGVLDVVGVRVRAQAAGQIGGAALGVLAACPERRAYPNAVFTLSEPTVEFDGTVTAIAAREEQTRAMLDALYFRLAEVTGREVDEIRDDTRRYRMLTAEQAIRYGLITERIEQR